MQYRRMPRSKDEISILGMGVMRMPCDEQGNVDEARGLEMLHSALNKGVNYFDTAWVYNRGQSELLLGKFLLQVPREKLLVATKLPCWSIQSVSEAQEILEKQLERLNTGYVDYYLLHSLGKNTWQKMKQIKILDWLEKVRADGLIRHIGFSFHDKFPVFKSILNAYPWDFCQIMLNFLDTHYQAGLYGYRLAAQKGIGVIAMEPLRGGKLVQKIPPFIEKTWHKSEYDWTPVQRALNWVWNLPDCTTLLSGMGSLDQIAENCAYAALAKPDSISSTELKVYNQVRLKYLKSIRVPCTECEYCLPCPSGVAIPMCFGFYNEAEMFAHKERSKREYFSWLSEASRAGSCTRCGVCLSKCPQQIAIPDRLEEVSRYFSTD
jgi:uncharacterized protein